MTLNRGHYIALGASGLIALWIMSGLLTSTTQTPPEAPVGKQSDEAFAVQVERYHAVEITPELTIHGESQANRMVNLTSEVDGKVIQILAREGEYVKKGQVIIKLDPQDKPQKLLQAQALVKQRELEFQANKQLIGQGLQNQTKLAESESLLAAARAQLKALEVSLEGTKITAPFSGILEDRKVELGSYLKTGNPVITLMDFNPFIIKGYVAEKDLHKVHTGVEAKGKTLDGRVYPGKVRYVSSQSYQASRTFAVELEIDNPSERQVNGVTADILVPLDKANAILISPALLSLNEQGVLGAKHVNAQEVVEFAPVELVKAQSDGVWISGLPNPVDLIVTGQSFVSAGEKVKPVLKKPSLEDISLEQANHSDPLTAEVN